MKPVHGVSIIIPCFNEEDNIVIVYKEILSVIEKLKIKDFEIIFVNDGSTDKTFYKLIGLSLKNKQVKVLTHGSRAGQSRAFYTGFRASSKELICFIDADLQISFSEFPTFFNKTINGLDGVVGWRTNRADGFEKCLLSGFASFIRRYFLGTRFHDFGCPFKLFKRNVLESVLPLPGEWHRYFLFVLEKQGFNIEEVIVSHRERSFGASKYGLSRIFFHFKDFVLCFVFHGRTKR